MAKHVLILMLVAVTSLKTYTQSIEFTQNEIKLKLDVTEDNDSLYYTPILFNNSKLDILISIYGITENYFTINEVTYMNFGALINSKQHPYLPLESKVTLIKIKSNDSYSFHLFSVGKKEIGEKIRLGIDYVVYKKVKNKVKQNEGYYLLNANTYKENLNYSYCIFKHCM